MNIVFADAAYWIAMLNPEDHLSPAAVRATQALGEVHFVTTQEVLTEFLNFFSGSGKALRRRVADAIQEILTANNVTVIEQSCDSFLAGLDRYAETVGSNHTDCVSMSTIEAEGIRDVLTTDERFGRAGLRILMERA